MLKRKAAKRKEVINNEKNEFEFESIKIFGNLEKDFGSISSFSNSFTKDVQKINSKNKQKIAQKSWSFRRVSYQLLIGKVLERFKNQTVEERLKECHEKFNLFRW